MADNLLNLDFLRLTDEGGKKSREDGNIRSNLVNFAENLSFSSFKAPQKQERFDT